MYIPELDTVTTVQHPGFIAVAQSDNQKASFRMIKIWNDHYNPHIRHESIDRVSINIFRPIEVPDLVFFPWIDPPLAEKPKILKSKKRDNSLSC